MKLTYLDGLTGDGIDRARCPHLELVQYHVPETLVIHDADVDVRREFLTGDAGVHRFVAVVVVACGKKLLPKIVNSGIFL